MHSYELECKVHKWNYWFENLFAEDVLGKYVYATCARMYMRSIGNGLIAERAEVIMILEGGGVCVINKIGLLYF